MALAPGSPASGRCWRVVGFDGSSPDWHDDGEPHHDTLAGAAGEIAHLLGEDTDEQVLTYRPQPYDRPCVTVDCDGCGHQLEDDDAGWTVHFPDGADPEVTRFGWTTDGAGRHFCGCPDTPSPAGPGVGVDRRPCAYDVPLPWGEL